MKSQYIKNQHIIFMMAILVWGAIAIFVWHATLWPNYHPNIMNDGDTLLYTSFALNLIECPFSISHGLMVNAIYPNCQPLMSGASYHYYLDHPPGMVMWLAPFLAFATEPIMVSRIIMVLFSAGSLLLCVWFAYVRIGLVAAIGALIASLFIPVFWFHSIVVNLNQATLFFSILMVISFIQYLSSKNNRWLFISLTTFIVGGITDWPMFFAAGPIGLFLLYQHRFKLFSAYFLIGVLTLVSIFAYFSIIPNGTKASFNVFEFFHAVFVSPLQSTDAPHLVPIKEAFWLSLINIKKAMSGAGTFLLIAPLIMLFMAPLRKQYLHAVGIFLACFYCQGVLNQFLFYQWAATHNYWSYYFLPVAFISGALLLDIFWKTVCHYSAKQIALLVGVLAIIMVLCLPKYKYLWRGYIKPPETITQYLKKNGLEGMLLKSATLLSETEAPFTAQGVKLRLIINKPLQSIQIAKNIDCKNVYTIYKKTTLTKQTIEQLPTGILLEQFDLYVIPSNHLNPKCSSS